jgi:hypothetical protein
MPLGDFQSLGSRGRVTQCHPELWLPGSLLQEPMALQLSPAPGLQDAANSCQLLYLRCVCDRHSPVLESHPSTVGSGAQLMPLVWQAGRPPRSARQISGCLCSTGTGPLSSEEKVLS